MTGSRRAVRRGLLYYIGLGLSAGLLAFLGLIGALVILIPAVSGSTPMTILTGSMQPTYPPGTLIIVQPIEPDAIVIGDPITYQIESGKPEVVTHRVVAISATGSQLSFTTQGDNNAVADTNPVQAIQVKGTLWYAIPMLGWVNSAVSGESRGILVPIVAGSLFAYAAWVFFSAFRARRLRRRRAAV